MLSQPANEPNKSYDQGSMDRLEGDLRFFYPGPVRDFKFFRCACSGPIRYGPTYGPWIPADKIDLL